MSISRRKLAWWLVAMAIAFALDGPVARFCQPISQVVKHSEVAEELKEGGHFIFVLILAAFIWILHPLRLRGAVLICLSGITSGAFYGLLKWMVGRTRPVVGIHPFQFNPFVHGFSGLFHSQNLSFPSGHACLAFATAECLAYLLPRGRWAFYVSAGLVAAERVGELAHYLSDTVASAGLGILAFHLVLRFCNWIDSHFDSRPVALPASS